jgi:hypothetical protein
MFLLSHGSNEHLKRTCSYARPSRFLVSTLTDLHSKAVYEFGAGKGVLFSLLEMCRQLHSLNVTCDVAVDSIQKVSQWSSFEAGELESLKEQGVVQYEKGESHTVQSFLRRYRQWRDQVSTINGKISLLVLLRRDSVNR